MKFLLTLCLALVVGLLCAACTTTGAPIIPPSVLVANACAADAVIRPTVTALMPLARPQDVLAIDAARAVIDPLCAPGATLSTGAPQALLAATGKIAAVVATLQQRKAAGAPKPPASAASGA